MEKFVDDDAHKDDVDFEFIKDKQLFNALSENQMKSELIQLSIVIQVHYVFIYKDFKQYPYLGRYTSNSYDQSDNIFPKCKIQISDGFIFESKIYRINHKVLDVMFKKTLQYVQENSSFKLARLMDKLNHLFTFTDNTIEKLDILKVKKKKLLNEYLKLMKGSEELIISFENPTLYGYMDLKENVIDSLLEHYKDIDQFLLSGTVRGLQVPDLWLECETFRKKMLLCKDLSEKLNCTSKVDFVFKKSTLSMKVFIDDGEQIFNYILKVYEDRLNPSFFSYLYDFLNTKLKKMRTKGLDSKKYRDYVEEVTKIKMSRIIYSDVNYSGEKSLMFDLFERYFTDYLDLEKMNNS